ncbi:MAG: antibiotic biosynthesis monooxygenase [Rhodospirillaceae bacterium]|jgi:quinol monooxygenase YgiN|nr:antibiotic biosynthesis monooxygenase [Rhodospirillaceae bacterium]MBT4115191.1 antibiotic biosynthesis monooxygenase [Rhodospirillaceae bacterium]MBT4673656.1 antibiotic biosynthesis monooxygenase [Rhodospirillaceae bacterium]MBT4717935.1 antibiotic biosynthesis monooxygenase [Rhodospirillaceae bacterium]MBT4750142.1 antibiotic biosynthesis monooxygenase [Rhodospirillaceae bacterium]
MSHRVFAYLKVPTDHQDSVASRAREYADTVRGEAGNLRFEITSNGAGESFFWEEFLDEAAFDAHTASEHVADWRTFYEPFMIERRLETVQPIA